MLSNLLIILVVILSCIMPIFCFLSFRWGVRFGNDKDRAANHKGIGWERAKKPKQSEEIDRVNRILDNIDNYQGDGAGQREIKA